MCRGRWPGWSLETDEDSVWAPSDAVGVDAPESWVSGLELSGMVIGDRVAGDPRSGKENHEEWMQTNFKPWLHHLMSALGEIT